MIICMSFYNALIRQHAPNVAFTRFQSLEPKPPARFYHGSILAAAALSSRFASEIPITKRL
jgi:hypothetical protein